MARPTQERVRELFDYDPMTGGLWWRVARAQMKPGDVAGSLRDTGYICVSVDRCLYRAHHIIWLWMTGEWPVKFIDHRDLNKANNKWGNLRPATKSQNQANLPALKTNKSGLKGAWYYKAYDRWTSQIWKDGKAYFLGYFDTAEEAHTAYAAKAKELYGEYARAA